MFARTRAQAHARYVSIFRVRLVFEKRIIPILCTRVYNSWNSFLLYIYIYIYVYATLTKSGTFKSVELSNGRELSFPRKYEIISLVFYLYSLVTNIVGRGEGGEKKRRERKYYYCRRENFNYNETCVKDVLTDK